MKNFILIITTILLLSCNGESNHDTIIQGNVFNIAENINQSNLELIVSEYKGQVEGIGAAVIIKEVISDAEGNFNFSFNAKSTRHYKYSVSPDHTANLLNPGPGLVLSKDVVIGQTNNVQLYVQTYSYVQTKIIQDMSYDSMYLEYQHLNIDSKNAQGMYVNQVSDGNLSKTPSGPRVYKTIKYLNGVETITIDTMDFEPMQTYNLEFHY